MQRKLVFKAFFFYVYLCHDLNSSMFLLLCYLNAYTSCITTSFKYDVEKKLCWLRYSFFFFVESFMHYLLLCYLFSPELFVCESTVLTSCSLYRWERHFINLSENNVLLSIIFFPPSHSCPNYLPVSTCLTWACYGGEQVTSCSVCTKQLSDVILI